MSDQGYGGSGPGEQPGWNQQPDNGGQPDPGGQYGAPPNQYGQYGDPQYPGGQYPQGHYPQAQYDPQYPQGQYDPQYPQQYGQPGFGGPVGPGGGASGGNSQKGLLIGLGAVVVAGLIVLVLAVTGVFSGDGSSTSTASPTDAVRTVLEASKNQNLGDVKKAVCQKDLADPDLADIVGKDHATGYTIGKAQENGDKATVEVTVTTSTNSGDKSTLPVVKEGGVWKVCFSEIASSLPTADGSASLPTPVTPSLPSVPSLPSISAPTGSTLSFCASSVDATTTARLFVSFVSLSLTDQAAGCVYQGRVSSTELASLSGTGKIYSPTEVSSQTGPVFTVTSATGDTTLKFTVERESDGKYYVTDVTQS